jgi:hypothetical protein
MFFAFVLVAVAIVAFGTGLHAHSLVARRPDSLAKQRELTRLDLQRRTVEYMLLGLDEYEAERRARQDRKKEADAALAAIKEATT